jgi:hypothetical protein
MTTLDEIRARLEALRIRGGDVPAAVKRREAVDFDRHAPSDLDFLLGEVERLQRAVDNVARDHMRGTRLAVERAEKAEQARDAALRMVEAELKWLRSEVVSICEHTEESCAPMGSREYETKMGAFARGRIHEAKGIRNAICEVVRVRLAALSPSDRIEPTPKEGKD